MRLPAAVEVECSSCGRTLQIPLVTEDKGLVDGEYVVEIYADVGAVGHRCEA